MSWELMHTSKAKCPCGNGIIKQDHFGDDWNRYKDGAVEIECEQCKKNYVVEEICHRGRLTSDGDWTEYFLVPAGYPKYSGITVKSVYPEDIVLDKANFPLYLIKKYTKADLLSALALMQKEKAYARLYGNAKQISKEYQRCFGKIRVSAITQEVLLAVSQYESVEDNCEHRLIIEKQEADQRAAYNAEKQKHMIRLDLRG